MDSINVWMVGEMQTLLYKQTLHLGPAGTGPSEGLEDYGDCSITSVHLAAGQMSFFDYKQAHGIQLWGIPSTENFLRDKSQTHMNSRQQFSTVRFGDIARWADSSNVAKHYANFLMVDDNGISQYFSRNGKFGTFWIFWENELAGYGTISGRQGDPTGYYGY